MKRGRAPLTDFALAYEVVRAVKIVGHTVPKWPGNLDITWRRRLLAITVRPDNSAYTHHSLWMFVATVAKSGQLV